MFVIYHNRFIAVPIIFYYVNDFFCLLAVANPINDNLGDNVSTSTVWAPLAHWRIFPCTTEKVLILSSLLQTRLGFTWSETLCKYSICYFSMFTDLLEGQCFTRDPEWNFTHLVLLVPLFHGTILSIIFLIQC